MAKPKKPEEAATLSTFVLLGNGGSLSIEDVAPLDRADVKVIAINDAWQFAPFAAMLYAADYRWWQANIDKVRASEFAGELATIDPSAAEEFGLRLFNCVDLHAPVAGINDNPERIHHGYSGGFQALQIARMMGAQQVILLGYDYGATGQSHGAPTQFTDSWSDHALMARSFSPGVAEKLANEGIEVINCTRATTIGVFRFARIDEVLAAR